MTFILKTCLDCKTDFVPNTGNSKRCRPCALVRGAVQEQATIKVHQALKNGKLVRQPCEVCGKRKVDAHHDDYSQPLTVRWLCRSHHQQLHAEQYGVRVTRAA